MVQVGKIQLRKINNLKAEMKSVVSPGASGAAEEDAPGIRFFASNADSSYITGEALTLLGGDTTAASQDKKGF